MYQSSNHKVHKIMLYVVENFFKSIDFSLLEISKFMIVILLADCFYSISTPEDGILTSPSYNLFSVHLIRLPCQFIKTVCTPG